MADNTQSPPPETVPDVVIDDDAAEGAPQDADGTAHAENIKVKVEVHKLIGVFDPFMSKSVAGASKAAAQYTINSINTGEFETGVAPPEGWCGAYALKVGTENTDSGIVVVPYPSDPTGVDHLYTEYYNFVHLSLTDMCTYWAWPLTDSPLPVLMELQTVMPDNHFAYYPDAYLLDPKLEGKAIIATDATTAEECVDAYVTYKATDEGKDNRLARIGIHRDVATGVLTRSPSSR